MASCVTGYIRTAGPRCSTDSDLHAQESEVRDCRHVMVGSELLSSTPVWQVGSCSGNYHPTAAALPGRVRESCCEGAPTRRRSAACP